MKTESGRIFFLCALHVYFTNLVLIARKPAFLHHLRRKQNYQALFVYMLLIILQFNRTILQDKLHSFNIQDDRSTSFSFTTNYKNDNNRKR